MSAADVGLLFVFCFKITKLNVNIIWHLRLLCFVLSTIFIYGATLLSIFSVGKVVACGLCLFLCLFIITEDALDRKIIYFMIFYLSLGASETLSVWMISEIQQTLFNDIVINQTIDRVIIFAIARIVFLLGFVIILRLKEDNGEKLPYNYRITFISILSFLLIAMLFFADILFSSNAANDIKYFNELMIIIIVVLLISYFGFFVLFEKLQKFYAQANEKNMSKYQYDTMVKYMEQKSESEDIIKELSHNLKHNLSYWLELTVKKKYDTLLNEIQKYKGKIETQTLMDLGNDSANTIINEKFVLASRNGISFKINGIFEDAILISRTDFFILLGNLLDNAIEASQKVSIPQNRFIELTINKDGKFLYLDLTNSYSSEPMLEENKFLSSKINGKNHGIGTISINNIVKKHNGAIDYNFKDSVFNVFIMILHSN